MLLLKNFFKLTKKKKDNPIEGILIYNNNVIGNGQIGILEKNSNVPHTFRQWSNKEIRELLNLVGTEKLKIAEILDEFTVKNTKISLQISHVVDILTYPPQSLEIKIPKYTTESMPVIITDQQILFDEVSNNLALKIYFHVKNK